MKNTSKGLQLILIAISVLLLTDSCKKVEDNDQITDGDGNVYTSVTIGTQVWLKENLKTTTYNDGSDIPLVTDNTAWAALSTPGYCWFNNDITNKDIYGALYNWQAVYTGKLCPAGWHVPTDEEWDVLVEYTGGNSISGGKLKETGLNHWNDPNLDATDVYGFTALGAGYRDITGPFKNLRIDTYWWSSTEHSAEDAWARYIFYYNAIVFRVTDDYNYGQSVRCLKN